VSYLYISMCVYTYMWCVCGHICGVCVVIYVVCVVYTSDVCTISYLCIFTCVYTFVRSVCGKHIRCVYCSVFVYIYVRVHICVVCHTRYGVATISRLLKIIGLFCKRAL